MNEFQLRETLAESGKMNVKDMLAYLKVKHTGKYDLKLAREAARELCHGMKKYIH